MEEELNLEREFVIKPLALRMKLIGFNEPCIAHFRGYDLEPTPQLQVEFNTDKNSDFGDGDYWISAPTWQSAFAWVKKVYGYDATTSYGNLDSESLAFYLDILIEQAEKRK